VGKFVEAYNRHRCNHEEIEYLNRPSITKEIESVIKHLPTKKSQGLGGFTGKFHKTFNKELKPILLKLFQKTEVEETLIL